MRVTRSTVLRGEMQVLVIAPRYELELAPLTAL